MSRYSNIVLCLSVGITADRGILMTYGSGTQGCLGHGNYHDVMQVLQLILTFSPCFTVAIEVCDFTGYMLAGQVWCMTCRPR